MPGVPWPCYTGPMPKGRSTPADANLMAAVNAEAARRGRTERITVRQIQEWRNRFEESTPLVTHIGSAGTITTYPPQAVDCLVSVIEHLARIRNSSLTVFLMFGAGWNPHPNYLRAALDEWFETQESALKFMERAVTGEPVRVPAALDRIAGESVAGKAVREWQRNTQAASVQGETVPARSVFSEDARVAATCALTGDLSDLLDRTGLRDELAKLAVEYGRENLDYLFGDRSPVEALREQRKLAATIPIASIKAARDAILAGDRSTSALRWLASEPALVAWTALGLAIQQQSVAIALTRAVETE
jgi:hypothetical protein